MSSDTSFETKFFSLSIYDSVTSSRWMDLPREKILSTVMELIRVVAVRGLSFEKPLLRKLDKVFVNAVKHEWLNDTEIWKSVIPQLATLSGTDQNLWENTMVILNMLSEDIFDFGAGTMTSKKVGFLKQTLAVQFPHIERLCGIVLEQYVVNPAAVKPSLVNATLSTMSHYYKWVNITDITFKLVNIILTNIWDNVQFRIECVKCMCEIFSMEIPNFSPHEVSKIGPLKHQMFVWYSTVCEKLGQIPNRFTSHDRLFYEVLLNQVSIMFTSVVKCNIWLMFELADSGSNVVSTLIRATDLASDEGFKSFMAMWLGFTDSLVASRRSQGVVDPDDILTRFTPQVASCPPELLTELSKCVIGKMAQPPEVTISETEDGEIVREDSRETAEIDLYVVMAKILQNICFLNRSGIEGNLLQMLQNLIANVRNGGVGWASLLSKIVWSAGSIAGVTPSRESEQEERRFTFEIIRELLGLCNLHNSKTNRAIVASNVLFYCGKHHRFLRSNHKFLRTVFKKLFEFMLETTPGVKEMACDTFLVICRSCVHKLVVPIVEGTAQYSPFVDSLSDEICQYLSILDPLQICTVYEGIGLLMGAINGDLERQQNLCLKFTNPFLTKWQEILFLGNQNSGSLFDLNVTRDLSLFLRVLERLSFGIAHGNVVEPIIGRIYEDILRIYKLYSLEGTNTAVAVFKSVQKVKGDCLRLVSTYVSISVKDAELAPSVAANIIPRLLDYVLEDYKICVQTRNPEVLFLLASICRHLSNSIAPAVGSIWDKTFEPTRQLLSGRENPDHRFAFYTFLLELTRNCFEALLNHLIQFDQLIAYLETIVAGVENENPQISSISLNIVSEFLDKLQNQTIYQQIHCPLVGIIIGVLTDKLHDAGKEAQIRILQTLLTKGNACMPNETVQNLYTVLQKIGLKQWEIFTHTVLTVGIQNPDNFKQLMNDLKIVVQFGGQLDL